jgi:lipoprotein-anchoring transpeptidase ErfK/SrfK
MLAAFVVAALVTPAARAQADGLYFPSTGHHLADEQGFLAFWRAHDGEHLLGFPIAEAQSVDGAVIQYFERGRLEQQIDAAGASHVATGRVGAEYAEALWKRFAPMPPHQPAAGEQVFAPTGHSLREPFLSFWQAGGGLEFFGAPISEPAWELTARGRLQVQYFERARLERDPQMAEADAIQVGNLGRALAVLRGIDLAPVPNLGYASFGPPAPAQPNIAPLLAPQPTPPPAPAAPPAAATAPKPQPKAQPRAEPNPAPGGAKRIVVNLSDQWLYAYEGQRQVFDARVSTGRNGMETPTGTYSIYAKLKIQTMDGVTDGKRWVVPDVPNVMYINGGVALHGTYWHNRFGTGARLSHGCVNLPLDAAAWLYSWAPMGTRVDVTY